MLEKEYLEITYLKDNGYERKLCPSCNKYFWTKDTTRDSCGDPPCEPYSFIGSPVFTRNFDLSSMRDEFISFFEQRGHEKLDPYPVVARWRDDIYLTIASIADFQPFVTSGEVPPPSNPLVISQPCIRLDDLDSVGKTGRHLTVFEMMAHHAFNNPKKEIYWKNETVAYCKEFLNSLGVHDEEIIFKEEPWAGGGNAGPCLETLVGGLELATLVFMNLETAVDGDIEIKGEKYRKMDNYIVDTGYGLERFVWASQGTPTVYDAIFPDVIQIIKQESEGLEILSTKEVGRVVGESSKLAGMMSSLKGKKLENLRITLSERLGMEISELLAIIDPMEKMYALADHSRCLLFMLNDGLIPSNAGAGYLARLVIRRSIRMAEEIGFKLPLIELLKAHMNSLKEFSFEKRLTLMDKILKSEEEKYRVTISRGIKMVERLLKKQKTISENNLVELYESHGLPPEVVKNVAMRTGVDIEIPETFYSKLAQQHIKGEREEQELDPELIKQYPPTRKLYYEQPYQKSFEAMVLGVRGNNIILDRTLFYPEGGGQMYDTGYIQSERGSTRVIEVHEMGDIILHRVEDPSMVSIGEVIKGEIDFDRRKRHMQHHTATHIILYAAKRVLGDHIWQAGARKEEYKARLDITHYRKLSREEVRKIEEIANEMVRNNIKVEWKWMDRIEAEKKFGFTLYQGGVPPGKQIRVVQIDRDVQACGGTHCSYTGEVGVIKVIRADRIQDGVDRLEFAAGSAALKHIQKRDEILEESARILRVDVEKLPDTVKRFFEEWKDQKKQIEKMVNKLAYLQVKELIKGAEKIDKIRLVTEQFSDMDQQELIKIGEKLKDEKNVIAILISNGKSLRVVISVSDEVIQRGIYANALIRVMCSTIGGGGGGKKDLAQGGGTSPEKVEEGIEKVIEYIQEKI